MLTWQHCKGAFLSYFKSYLNNKETDSLNSPLFGITWHLVSSHRNTLTQENTSAVVISPGWLWYLMSQGDQNTHKADTKEPWETISVWVWVSVCVSLCEVLLCDSLGGLKACPNGWAIWSSGDWLERKRLLFFSLLMSICNLCYYSKQTLGSMYIYLTLWFFFNVYRTLGM